MIKLKDFKNLAVSMNHTCTGDDDMNERRMVCPNSSRSIVALTINHDIVKKDCVTIKWEAMRYDGMVKTTMNWSQRKMIAEGGCE